MRTQTTSQTYRVHSGVDDVYTIEASSPQEAAERFAADGEWGDHDSTTWVHVWVDDEPHTVTIEPDEPACVDDAHDYHHQSVWGNGGGVVNHYRYDRCGLIRSEDTWAQDRETGEQGLHSTTYSIRSDG